MYPHMNIQRREAILCARSGSNKNKPLPGSPEASAQLRNTAITLLDAWNRDFGATHRQLGISMRFLKARLGAQVVTASTVQRGQNNGQIPNGRAPHAHSDGREDDRRQRDGGHWSNSDVAANRNTATAAATSEECSIRERQVNGMLRDAPAVIRAFETHVDQTDERLTAALTSQSDHFTMFDDILRGEGSSRMSSSGVHEGASSSTHVGSSRRSDLGSENDGVDDGDDDEEAGAAGDLVDLSFLGVFGSEYQVSRLLW
jgi:hypothetical protein